MAGPGTVPPKRKEIYKYEAPWTVFSMNWSVRPDKRFRLALGSFVEEYNNKVQVSTRHIRILNMWKCSNRKVINLSCSRLSLWTRRVRSSRPRVHSTIPTRQRR